MHKKIKSIILSALVILLFSCSRVINVKTTGEIIELKNFTGVKGKHCESTAMMNALNYQGLHLSEAMINGLSSSISFMFVKEGGFPFLGGRVNNLKENFSNNTGIKIIDYNPENPQDAYDWAKSILKKNIPVVLRVDMRYLPYRYNGKYGPKYSSFGWHFVTLVKLDEIEGYAYVTETDEQGLKTIEKIKIADLAKARNSKEGFLKADNYCYYFDDPSKVKIDYKICLKNSLHAVINNMNNNCLNNLSKLESNIINIENYIKSKYMLKPLFYTFYGYIEIFGTGGSAFRNFYRDYLKETGTILNNPDIINTSLYVDDSCKKWYELANEFKYISENIEKNYKDKNKRIEMYKKAGIIVKELYNAEKIMTDRFKKLEISIMKK